MIFDIWRMILIGFDTIIFVLYYITQKMYFIYFVIYFLSIGILYHIPIIPIWLCVLWYHMINKLYVSYTIIYNKQNDIDSIFNWIFNFHFGIEILILLFLAFYNVNDILLYIAYIMLIGCLLFFLLLFNFPDIGMYNFEKNSDVNLFIRYTQYFIILISNIHIFYVVNQ